MKPNKTYTYDEISRAIDLSSQARRGELILDLQRLYDLLRSRAFGKPIIKESKK